jgi:hypothetical protein
MRKASLPIAITAGLLGTLFLSVKEASAQQRTLLPPVQPPLAWVYNPKTVSASDLGAARVQNIDVSNVVAARRAASTAAVQNYIGSELRKDGARR